MKKEYILQFSTVHSGFAIVYVHFYMISTVMLAIRGSVSDKHRL